MPSHKEGISGIFGCADHGVSRGLIQGRTCSPDAGGVSEAAYAPVAGPPPFDEVMKLRMNSRMRPLLESSTGRADMSATGQDLLDLGWVVGPAGSLLLKGMWGSGFRRTGLSPGEVGGYEYEVNDVYLPIVQERSIEQTLVRAAQQGIDFAVECLASADGLPSAELLVGVVSVVTEIDEDFSMQGTTVRFFTERGDYPDWWDDIERFERDAIALVRAGDSEPGWIAYDRSHESR